jgi:hypothetical protein
LPAIAFSPTGDVSFYRISHAADKFRCAKFFPASAAPAAPVHVGRRCLGLSPTPPKPPSSRDLDSSDRPCSGRHATRAATTPIRSGSRKSLAGRRRRHPTLAQSWGKLVGSGPTAAPDPVRPTPERGNPRLAIRGWQSGAGNPGLAIRGWQSGAGSPGLAVRGWQSGAGSPGLAAQAACSWAESWAARAASTVGWVSSSAGGQPSLRSKSLMALLKLSARSCSR